VTTRDRLARALPVLGLVACAAASLGLGSWAVRALGTSVAPAAPDLARELGGLTLIAAVVFGSGLWLVRRWRPRFVAPVGLDPEAGRNAWIGGWLLSVRWLAAVALGAVAVQVTVVDPRLEADAVWLVWVAIGALFAFNAALTWRGPGGAGTEPSVCVQIGVDTVLLALCLMAAGGVLNPFASFFIFHAVIAALLLPARVARLATAWVAAVPAVLAGLAAAGVVTPYCLLREGMVCVPLDRVEVMAVGIAIVAITLGSGFVVSALTGRLQSERDSLAQATRSLRAEAATARAAEGELAAEQRKLEVIVDCIADAVLVAAPDGRILLANRAALSLWPEHPGGVVDDLRVCHEETHWSAMLAKLANPSSLERHPTLNIGDRSFEATYGPVTHADGTAMGAVMVARDVTERAKEQQMREQRERMVTIGKLAAALAHEINNPLGSIQLYTQLALKRLGADDPLADHLTTVLRNANGCKKIVRDLLDYARQRPPERGVYEARELLERAASTIRPQAERAGVDLLVQGCDAACDLHVDADQVVQVLVNLGLNAVEAMAEAPADRPRRLELACDRCGGVQVTLAVTDTGPGVREDAIESLFSPFFTTKAEGTGLGLSVVRDITRAHGGQVDLAANSPAGARFEVRLPAAHDGP